MNNIIITTTSQIEDAKIEKYLGIVTTNIVIGTNAFSDIAASFTDLFGGNSDTYQRKLQLIYKEGMNDLSAKAIALGANCILGLHIDFDEISGKGKSMFMASLLGTAVKISKSQKDNIQESLEVISADYLTCECLKKRYAEKFRRVFPKEDEWEYILSHNMPELANVLYQAFVKSCSEYANYEHHELTRQNFPIYLNKLEYDYVLQVVYSEIEDAPMSVLKLISNLKLFSSEAILKLVNNQNVNLAATLLSTEKSTYTKDDLLSMQKIVAAFRNLPDLGSVEMVKGGLLSKETQKYLCPQGHKNSSDTVFCQECGQNIKGLTENSTISILEFNEKTEVLASIFMTK